MGCKPKGWPQESNKDALPWPMLALAVVAGGLRRFRCAEHAGLAISRAPALSRFLNGKARLARMDRLFYIRYGI